MQLRPYQSEAVDACYRWLGERDSNPCIVIPTGGGKTPVMATIANDAVTRWGGRVMILAHVRELLEQTAGTIQKMYPDLWTGVYSAGLKSRETRADVIVAGIQSVADRAEEFGPRDLVLIDEAHLIPPDGFGRYRQFLADLRQRVPHCRLIGLTATPYRTGTGLLCGPNEFLNEICYEASIPDLIAGGYLSKITSKCGQQVDTGKLHVRRGEYVEAEAEALMMGIVGGACQRLAKIAENRRSVLIFGCTVRHAESIVGNLERVQSAPVGLITGMSLDFDRKRLIEEFKAGSLKYLVNVNVLTTGFDAPNVDCVALMRPTVSPGLYYQMVGRGFRLAPGKTDCVIVDFGANVLRHGPVDRIRPRGSKSDREPEPAPQKVCPQCSSYVPAAIYVCPDCEYVFIEERQPNHSAIPSEDSILSEPPILTHYEVIETRYMVHRKKGWQEGMPQTLRVRYCVDDGLNPEWIDEWICFEHDGYPRQKAESWWRARSDDPIPNDVDRAFDAASGGALAATREITVAVRAGDKFPRITKYVIGPKPEPIEAPEGGFTSGEDFEFPFSENAASQNTWGAWADDAPF